MEEKMTKMENQGLCICPVRNLMFLGNPEADDQRCFWHWFEANEHLIPDSLIELTGAGGFNYYAIPNTIKEMTHEDWIDYVSHLPRNAFVQTIYRTILHNSGTPPKNGIKVFIGFQMFHISHGWADLGYHGGWTPNGKSYLGRNWTYKGAHAHAIGNAGSLGLVMVGSFSNDGFPTSEQIKEYSWLVNLISQHMDIKYNSGHRWEDNHPTSCPGYNITRDLISLWASDKPEVDDMGFGVWKVNLKEGSTDRYSGWLRHSQGKLLMVDIVNNSTEKSLVRVSARRDNGDWCPPYITGAEDGKLDELEYENATTRFEIGELYNLPEGGGISTKIECLAGDVTLKYAETLK